MPQGKAKASTVVACLAILAVSGCTQTGDGTPTSNGTPSPITTPASSGASTGASASSPAVTNPLDVSKFMVDPCASITSTQASNLTISPQGRRVDIQTGQACDWLYGPNLEWDAAVTYIVPDAKNGLQNLYNLEATIGHQGGYFEPTTIDGYPAVYEDVSDGRQNGDCQLSVGVNEQVFFSVLNRGPKNTDLCKGAAKVATAVVETIKRG